MTVTWDSALKSVHARLSNGNLTATTDGNGTNYCGLATANSAISGSMRIYWEAVVGTVSNSTSPAFGFGNASMNLNTNIAADANSMGYLANGTVWFNGSSFTTIATYTNGDVISIAIDFAAAKVWFGKNGGNWNNNTPFSENPAVGSQVGGLALGVAGTVFPAYNLSTAAAFTAKFGATGFTVTVPNGFLGFDTNIVAPVGQKVM